MWTLYSHLPVCICLCLCACGCSLWLNLHFFGLILHASQVVIRGCPGRCSVVFRYYFRTSLTSILWLWWRYDVLYSSLLFLTRLLRHARHIDWKFQARDWMHSPLFVGVQVRYSTWAILPRVHYSTRILGFLFLGKCALFICIRLVFTWCRFAFTDVVAINFLRLCPFALWIMFCLLNAFGLVDASLYEIL